MPLYKIRIYDLHETPEVIEDELFFVPKDIEWKVFHLNIDIDFIQITGFRSFALFDKDNNVQECTKVFLSDGSVVYATNSLSTFEANYKNDYLKLIQPNAEQKPLTD